MDKELTIKQAAQALGVSTQTIRRRMEKGELSGRKEVTALGERWLIPADQIKAATRDLPVVPVTRQIGLSEIQTALQGVIEQVVSSAVDARVTELKDQISLLEEKLDTQSQILEGHYQLVDERLRQIMERDKPKSFWQRLLGR